MHAMVQSAGLEVPESEMEVSQLSRHDESNLVPLHLPGIRDPMDINLLRFWGSQLLQDGLLCLRSTLLLSNEAHLPQVLFRICLRRDDNLATSSPLHVLDKREVVATEEIDSRRTATETVSQCSSNAIILGVWSKANEVELWLLVLPQINTTNLSSFLNALHIPQKRFLVAPLASGQTIGSRVTHPNSRINCTLLTIPEVRGHSPEYFLKSRATRPSVTVPVAVTYKRWEESMKGFHSSDVSIYSVCVVIIIALAFGLARRVMAMRGIGSHGEAQRMKSMVLTQLSSPK